MNLGTDAVVMIVSIAVGNIGIIFGFFVSLKVSQAVLGEKVGRLERDVNNLANMIRELNSHKERVLNEESVLTLQK